MRRRSTRCSEIREHVKNKRGIFIYYFFFFLGINDSSFHLDKYFIAEPAVEKQLAKTQRQNHQSQQIVETKHFGFRKKQEQKSYVWGQNGQLQDAREIEEIVNGIYQSAKAIKLMFPLFRV